MISCNSNSSNPGSKIRKNKRPASFLFDDEIDEDELGAETEAEKQMQILLEKQLNTKLSMKDQIAQHRSFCCPSTYHSLTKFVKGPCTLERFKEIEKDEELHQELQRCGLTEEQIMYYISFKSGKKKGNYNIDPVVWENKIKAIEEKIKSHNAELLKPQTFKNVKMLTRHEMEIEQSLYAGCNDKSKLSTLVSIIEDNQLTDLNEAFGHIKILSEMFSMSKRKKRRMDREQTLTSSSVNDCGEDGTSSTANDCGENGSFQFDRNIHHVVVPLEEDEVKEKCLSFEEIRKLPKFGNYQMGQPSTTLYLKNLHPKITIYELHSLFGSFEEDNNFPIDYKICTGRMKGQAFVKFSDVKIAEKALHHVNGYSLRGKPIVIEFGKRNLDCTDG